MTLPRLLLHIGYGKTGTSTLQKAVFEPLRQQGRIHYFGMFLREPKDHPDRRFFDDLQAAMYLEDAPFDAALPKLREDFAAAVKRADEEVPMVLSNEHFLLSAYSSRIAGAKIIAARTADRLSRVFGGMADVSLLAGIRRQDAFFRSFFVESAARAGHANSSHFHRLGAFVEDVLDQKQPFHAMGDYGANFASFAEAFPEAKLRIYLFEDFIDDPSPAIRLVFDALGKTAESADTFASELPNVNAKRRVAGGSEIAERGALESRLRSIPILGKLAAGIANSGMFSPLKRRLRPTRTVRHLRPDETERLLAEFEPANRALATAHPELAESLAKHSYLSNTGNRGLG